MKRWKMSTIFRLSHLLAALLAFALAAAIWASIYFSNKA